MIKFYKPIFYTVAVFFLVLLMHYMRCGMLQMMHVLSLSAFFAAGLALGMLGDLAEQDQS